MRINFALMQARAKKKDSHSSPQHIVISTTKFIWGNTNGYAEK
jgi:hypothetical protein